MLGLATTETDILTCTSGTPLLIGSKNSWWFFLRGATRISGASPPEPSQKDRAYDGSSA